MNMWEMERVGGGGHEEKLKKMSLYVDGKGYA